jgi:hypothetical protein
MAHALPPHDDHAIATVPDGDDLPHHGPHLEEPRSPMWLPYLGAALFGLAVVWWLSTPSQAEEDRAAAAASASASASAAASAGEAKPEPPKPQPQPTLTAVPAPPRPAATAANIPKAAVTIAPTVSINPNFKKQPH